MKQIVSRGHTRPLTEISFVSDGSNRTLLVSSAHDKSPQIRDGETGDWIGTFHGHKGAVWSAKVDRLTRTLAATASGDFTARLWCATTGKELCELKHKHIVKTIDFSMDSLQIATGCHDGLMRIYNTCKPENPPTEIRVSPSSQEAVTKISWSCVDKDLLVLGKKDGLVEKWDMRLSNTGVDAKPVRSFNLPNKITIMDLHLNENCNMVLIAAGNKICSLDAKELTLIREYEMPKPLNFNEEGGVALSPDTTKFLTGGSDLWLREFDLATGELLRTNKGHHGPIRCVRYHPGGKVGASGSEDGTIRLWDLSK